jgi:hypothetical protein
MRKIVIVLAVLVVAVIGYGATAAVGLGRLADAARQGDGDAILARTDLPRLKKSLVFQVLEAYLEGRPRTPRETLIANTVGATLIDAAVERLLSRENIAAMLRNGEVKLGGPGGSLAVPDLSRLAASDISTLIARVRPASLVEFTVRLTDADTPDAYGGIKMRFDGGGWRLSGLDLPRSVLREIAKALPRSS